MEKRVLDRRLDQMRAEGTEFRTSADVGGSVPISELEGYEAVVLAGGATQWRDLPIPGRSLGGILQAMEYLPPSNRVQEGDRVEGQVSAEGRHVVIIGGGDTGADCLGTAHRQGAASVHQFEIMPRPPEERDGGINPWPTYPNIFRVSSAHEEGGERWYAVNTLEFLGDGDGQVSALRGLRVGPPPTFEPIEGSEFELPCQLVLLAMGFLGPQRQGLLEQLGVELDARGNVARDANWRTSRDGVFVCGDMGRGQSLIVWAISEGRSCAAAVDQYLMGDTLLPRPLVPNAAPLR
jgi:glutamate synthase (NADPH/NADH) small chain